jgi:hypothetical protein
MILRLPQLKIVDPEFKAWAFGCLSMFYLEDRNREREETLRSSHHQSQMYDPENWKIQ